MQRDLLLLEEMIDAAEQAHSLVVGRTVAEIEVEPGAPGRDARKPTGAATAASA